MPIPPFNVDGVLPPYVGPSGPGGAHEHLSPYSVTAPEVESKLGWTENRRTILRGWLRHRARLRSLGFDRGFQWCNGSFVEQKEPQDLDGVRFLHRPLDIRTGNQLAAMIEANKQVFDRTPVKAQFKLDTFLIDLDGGPESIVKVTRYFLGLFSHRRGDDVWKGMFQVRLEDVEGDAAALAKLGTTPSVAVDNGENP